MWRLLRLSVLRRLSLRSLFHWAILSLIPWNLVTSLAPTVRYFSAPITFSSCSSSLLLPGSSVSLAAVSCSVKLLLLTRRSLLEKLQRFLIFFQRLASATGGDILSPGECPLLKQDEEDEYSHWSRHHDNTERVFPHSLTQHSFLVN